MAKSKPGRRAGPAGVCARADHKDGPQLVRTGGKRWSDAAERIFIDRLAASCNVSLAAEEAGFSTAAVYARRRNDPGLAERWREALEQGCVRIETAMVRAAADTMEGLVPDPETPIPTMTVKEALMVLGHARASLAGERRRPRGGVGARPLDEVRAGILRKLEVIEAARVRAGGESLPLRLTAPPAPAPALGSGHDSARASSGSVRGEA